MNDFGSLIEPPPVPFRFGAPGWYVLAALILIALIVLTTLLVKHYRQNSYRRQAIRWLRLREEASQQQSAPVLLVYEANMLLKRIAMGRYGRTVAAFRDLPWINLLNQSMHRSLFDEQDRQLLNQLLYQPQATISPETAAVFASKSITWIQHHRYHYAL